MRYLASKKHKAFIIAVLRIFLFFATIITFAAFGKNSFSQFLNEYRWQLYLLLMLAFLYTLIKKMPFFCVSFFILVAVNFFCITSTMNILNFHSNDKSINILFENNNNNLSKAPNRINKNAPDIIAISNSDLNNFDTSKLSSVNYNFLPTPNKTENNLMLSKLKVKNSGRINLDKNLRAPFMKVEHQQTLITFVAVDFSKFSYKEISLMLKKLSSFISQQDNPVVVFGDFNNVSWSHQISSFISENSLVVKNSMSDNFRNLIFPPHYYILGYEKGNFQGNISLPILNSFSKFTRF